jgi:hypothetical protein
VSQEPDTNDKIKREQISKRMRFEVFKRDGFECQYCGATPPGVLLHCDHIEPVSLGGKTEIDNLITACQPCNLGKSNIPLGQVVQSMADRAAEVIEREAQVAGYQSVLKDRRMRLEADAQEVLEELCERYGRDGIPRADFTSIKRFVDRIGLDSCLEAVEIAASRHRGYRTGFRYFCGICWNRIRAQDGGADGSHS